jgi:hypothetical protein
VRKDLILSRDIFRFDLSEFLLSVSFSEGSFSFSLSLSLRKVDVSDLIESECLIDAKDVDFLMDLRSGFSLTGAGVVISVAEVVPVVVVVAVVGVETEVVEAMVIVSTACMLSLATPSTKSSTAGVVSLWLSLEDSLEYLFSVPSLPLS